MRRLIAVIGLCLLTFPALCQSPSKWQIAIITEVKPRQATGGGTSEKTQDANYGRQDNDYLPARYDVSVKVGDTIYVVLYTPPLREETVKYATGRDLLVLVGKNTIRYNDIMGQSRDVPIESQKSAVKPSPTKPVSRGN